jgi:hypothetical protein
MFAGFDVGVDNLSDKIPRGGGFAAIGVVVVEGFP